MIYVYAGAAIVVSVGLVIAGIRAVIWSFNEVAAVAENER